MGESNNTAKEIDLGNGFGDVAVKANGIRVELHADGSVVAYTKSDVDAYTNGAVHVHPAANDSAAVSAEPQIGDVMSAGHAQAGWIYAGISKTTHEPFYVAPKDSGVFKRKEAMAFAAKEGSRVPSKEELDQIYDAREQGALKGIFNTTGSHPAGWYWSSTRDNCFKTNAWTQRFSDGIQDPNNFEYDIASLRCVCG
jgi:hypothetical protein